MRWISQAVKLSYLGIALATFPDVSVGEDRPVTTQNGATTPAPREGSARRMHERFLERASQGPIDLLFLGDSITQGWNENPIWLRYYGSRRAANFGIGGDRTQHVLWRLDHGEIRGIRPRVVVLMIGTNNIRDNTPEEIADGIEAIVDRLRSDLPESHVLLLGIFPRGLTRDDDRTSDATDPRVQRVNDLIAPLGEREGVTFLDLGERFLDPDGNIPRDVMPDFLHLSRKGYRIWAEALEPTLWRLMEGG